MTDDESNSVINVSKMDKTYDEFYGLNNFKIRVYLKYNRACMYGICILGIILILAIACTTSCDECCGHEKKEEVFNRQEESRDTIKRTWQRSQKCTSFKICAEDNFEKSCSMDLAAMNKLIAQNTSSCDEIEELRIYNIIFPDNILKKEWLVPYLQVDHLGIGYKYKTACVTLEEGAFDNDKQFENLQELTFVSMFDECRAPFLKKSMFEGLKNLIRFQIQPVAFREVKFEEDLLEVFAYLEDLQVLNSFAGPESLKNLTGVKRLGKIKTVDFRYNERLGKIIARSFIGVPTVAQIFLDSCFLVSIEENAFFGLNAIELISLTDNHLTILQEDIFMYLNGKLQIGIKNNLWKCSCELNWMLRWSKYKGINETNCFNEIGRAHIIGIYLNNICQSTTIEDISEETTRLTQRTTEMATTKSTKTPGSTMPESKATPKSTILESTITESTTPESKTTITTSITEFQTETTKHPSSFATEETTKKSTDDSTPTKVTEPPIKISCQNEEEDADINLQHRLKARLMVKKLESNKIEIMLKNNAKDLILIYLNPEEEENISGCISEINRDKSIVVDSNIKENTSYVFCLQDKQLSSVSPFDCVAAKTLPSKDYQTWLVQKDMMGAYLIFGFSLVFAIIFTTISAYYILRKYPNLLKNDQIIIIQPHKEIKNLSSLFVPRIPETPIFLHPEGEVVYDRKLNHVYLSPLVNRSVTRRRAQSFSDTSSDRNTLASYVAVVDPSPSQLMTWRYGSINGTRLNEMYQASPAQTPPIPPPRRKFSHFNIRDETQNSGYY